MNKENHDVGITEKNIRCSPPNTSSFSKTKINSLKMTPPPAGGSIIAEQMFTQTSIGCVPLNYCINKKYL